MDRQHALAPALTEFHAVMRTGSFAGAATELRLTPTTVSRSIHRLEHRLRLRLFVPQGRGVAPTAAATELARYAERALDELAVGLQRADLEASPAPLIRLGFIRTLGASFVPRIVAAYRRPHPDVRFVFEQGVTDDLLDAVSGRRIDAALVSPPPARDGLTVTALFDQPLVVVPPPDSPFAGRGEIALAELADEGFILAQAGLGTRAATDALFLGAGFEPRIVLETEDMAMARAMAQEGLGLALVPGPAPGDPPFPQEHVRLTDAAAVRSVVVVTASDAAESSPAVAFARFLAPAAAPRG
ncbi:Transcriptional regulator, LysR family OS=Tsukamurella paurometabola (strain ATCC 8368 / DSM/ CCUG 35730 / CIP 100753 / JCM 10117 / KCTC 9821 / NBRC 16120/ NCIMB 702349 / NCTC 13040) OX=521096 GN=Tpau_4029 PE=3 SV=1 [Tsukamurella paurometabola]|uniref:Transcriptional regulator, LysR family n=2 Tax=Tsukamurella paurometabola TaxID=2061 RepID=D5UNA5_TSUPD|nr:transcriptional regulator, LysR family [Tsukamurella paurometabola DSM 20162]SUP40239.1 HTH-type transcriptional regulator gltC [Tsukamurella paurometabola]